MTAPAPETAGSIGATGQADGVHLRIQGLHKAYGSNQVLKGIDLEIGRGEVIALIGPSGGGKSTLLRCINWLELPTAGTIELAGHPMPLDADGNMKKPGRKELGQLRRRIGMVFQQFNLFPHMSALGNVMLGQRFALGRSKDASKDRAEQLLARVGLGDKASAIPAQLSGGQQQRIAIARALALDPEVMLFDEPTSAIDPELRVEVLAVIRELADAGMTMLIATHEMHFAEDVADRVVFLAGGVIVEQGPAKQVLREPQHERTQKFLRAVLGRG